MSTTRHFPRTVGEHQPIPGQQVKGRWGEGMVGVISEVTGEGYRVAVIPEADYHESGSSSGPELFLVEKDAEGKWQKT